MIIKRWSGQAKLEVGIMGIIINLSDYKKEKEAYENLSRDEKVELKLSWLQDIAGDDEEYIESFLSNEDLKEM